MYNLFEVQIFQSRDYIVEEVDADKRERRSRVSFEVKHDREKDYFQCDCGMYEHMAMICSHIIQLLSHLRRREIPASHIVMRWTKNACRDLPSHLQMYQKDTPAMRSTSFRHTALYRTTI